MNEHRYILEPYKGTNTRFLCPACKRKEFTRYIDKITGKYLNSSVGRCNRESNCGYHLTPKQYFQKTNLDNYTVSRFHTLRERKQETPPKSISFIPVELFKASLNQYKNNNLVRFLIDLFGNQVTTELVERYFIGTSKYRFKWSEYTEYKSSSGAVIFWQIDYHGRIRTGKIMLYNPATGKRIKEPMNHIAWVHNLINQPGFNLKQSFFGEHLLKGNNKPVAVVESEKTAIIASVYFPQFIWLAVGSLNNLTLDKCQVLKGRSVILFPDLNGFEKWSQKAKELSHLADFSVSGLLESKASETERKQGLDLADYLINFDYREFSKPETATTVSKEQRFTPADYVTGFVKFIKPEVGKWDEEIKELEQFFEVIPENSNNLLDLVIPVSLNKFEKIINPVLFVKSHLDIIKAQNGNERYKPYLDRLNELKILLSLN